MNYSKLKFLVSMLGFQILFSISVFSQISKYSKVVPLELKKDNSVDIQLKAMNKRFQSDQRAYDIAEQEITDLYETGLDIVFSLSNDKVCIQKAKTFYINSAYKILADVNGTIPSQTKEAISNLRMLNREIKFFDCSKPNIDTEENNNLSSKSNQTNTTTVVQSYNGNKTASEEEISFLELIKSIKDENKRKKELKKYENSKKVIKNPTVGGKTYLGQKGTIADDNVFILISNNPEKGILSSIDKGQIVNLIQKTSNNFFEVEFNGKIGYVEEKNIILENSENSTQSFSFFTLEQAIQGNANKERIKRQNERKYTGIGGTLFLGIK